MSGLMQEKGSGLGLKLCRDFVKLNGGTIRVESKLNKGTQFFFTVPGHTLHEKEEISIYKNNVLENA